MAKHNTTRLLSLLAGKHGRLTNIKFFRGDRDLVSAENIEEQMRSALVQKKSGRADVSEKFPDSETKPVDVQTFVSSL